MHVMDYKTNRTTLYLQSDKCICNGTLLIIPNDRVFDKVSDGILSFSVSQIVPEFL